MLSEKTILSAFAFERERPWVQLFYRFNIAAFERLWRVEPESFWQAQSERRALRLFHAAADRVPAYKDFLKKHRLQHERVKSITDLSYVPITDKKNYINQYPLESRCWGGSLATVRLTAVSSGTSGEPKYWPRGGYQEFEAAVIHELLYRYLFRIDKYRTLLLIGFPMGVYVSGMATVLPSLLVGMKNEYRLTVMSVGNSKEAMLRAVQHLGGSYQQIVLVGHPFFIKDVIETGKRLGVRWSSPGFNLKMMFCSEGFSETWRAYLAAEAGVSVVRGGVVSTYGSSEMLLMAYETPLSILVRQAISKNASVRQRLAVGASVPNIFQYNPFLRYIESVGSELIFTSASGLPLVRFNLHDSGRLISYAEVKQTLGQADQQTRRQLSRFEDKQLLWQLPFVVLSGRSDYTVIFYAANIYPEHIHAALNHRPFLKKLTGKFAMRKGYLKNMDEFLEINIELRPGVHPGRSLNRSIEHQVVKRLRELNLEYLDASTRLPKDLTPRIVLWPYQSERYFRPGLKPRYVVGD